MPAPFLTAAWRDLALLNYEIAPDVLAPLVPAGTELDPWRGVAYASVVGFRFLHVRVGGVPVPGHGAFDEVNLRFYVRRREMGEWRRGVVFVREIVPRRAVALAARWWYNEPYRVHPVRHALEHDDGGDVRAARYEWRRAGRWDGLSLAVTGALSRPADDSEEAFITEHYRGYTRQRDGSTVQYRVEHPRWRVAAGIGRLACDAAELYGPAFAEALGAAPRSAFLADGSAVTVSWPRRVAPARRT